MWKGFQRPKRLEFERETLTDRFGRFYAQPFERGFGTTIGNALRRVLLSSIEGAAITAVKIDGVLHEFSPIPGVVEDATDIILNLKQIPLKLHTDAPLTKPADQLAYAKQIVRAEMDESDPAYVDFLKEIARIELDVLALEATELRVVAQMARGIEPGAAASLFKIRGTEIFQEITELTHRAIGNYGLAIREQPAGANHFMPGPEYGHTASEHYLNSRKLSIYGGSNEIQRNIIAKAVLGL